MSFITAGGPSTTTWPRCHLAVGTVQDGVGAVRRPESSFVTGETLGVDGGHHLRRGADYSRPSGADQPKPGFAPESWASLLQCVRAEPGARVRPVPAVNRIRAKPGVLCPACGVLFVPDSGLTTCSG